jgi:hypothetical protein
MKISSESLEKADRHLQKALATAKQKDRIRAILILEPHGEQAVSRSEQPQGHGTHVASIAGGHGEQAVSRSEQPQATASMKGKKKAANPDLSNLKAVQIKPSQFASRIAYREALIDQRRSSLSTSIGPTIQSLRKLSLEVHGGQSTRAVVVEGSASNINRGLQLPGVRSAALDVRLNFRSRSQSSDESIE